MCYNLCHLCYCLKNNIDSWTLTPCALNQNVLWIKMCFKPKSLDFLLGVMYLDFRLLLQLHLFIGLYSRCISLACSFNHNTMWFELKCALNQNLLWTKMCFEPLCALNQNMLWIKMCLEPKCALNQNMLWTKMCFEWKCALNQNVLWTKMCFELKLEILLWWWLCPNITIA